MLNKLNNSKQKGFTIIEVMIVLAIAGLIILIVLLAIPALQRNGRNTAIKSDAGALTGAISSFVSNANGCVPNDISTSGLISIAGASPCSAVTEQTKLSGGTTVNAQLAATPTVVIAHGTLSYWIGHNCAGTASTRSVAVWYSIETSSVESVASNNRCVDA